MPFKNKTEQIKYRQKYYLLNKNKLTATNTKGAKNNPDKKKVIANRYTLKSKLAMLNYKGNFCFVCGYNKYYGALEFHHINPKDKELKLSETHSFTEKVRKELDKCVVLCANCHREVHAGLVECPSS